MRKFLCLLLVALTICGLCGCGDVNIPDNADYVIMKATHMNYGQNSMDDDFWSSTTYILNANGEMKCVDSYNISGENEYTFTVSKEKVEEIAKILDSQKFAKDDDSAMDGTAWDIEYFNADGKVISDYNGYIYDNKKYMQLAEILEELKKNNTEEKTSGLLARISCDYIGCDVETGKGAAISSNWSICYNGNVLYTFRSTGAESVKKTITINENKINEIATLLEENKSIKTSETMYDGVHWEIHYYEKDQKLVNKFDGYIDDYAGLVELTEIVKNIVE